MLSKDIQIVYGLGLRRINTVKVIWRLSSFTNGGRPKMPLRALLQAWVDTWVEFLIAE